MRILMVSDVYFPRVNGVSTSIQTFCREFVREGHEVTLIAPDYGPPSASAGHSIRSTSTEPLESPHRNGPDGFEVIRIDSRCLPLDPEDRLLRKGRIRRHHHRLAVKGFDLVHIQTPFVAHYAGVKMARRLGVPVVESYHTYFEHYLEKYIPLLPASLVTPSRTPLFRRPVQ